jgi:hypothetical protein
MYVVQLPSLIFQLHALLNQMPLQRVITAQM